MEDSQTLLQVILALVGGGLAISIAALTIGCKQLSSVSRDVNRIIGALRAKGFDIGVD